MASTDLDANGMSAIDNCESSLDASVRFKARKSKFFSIILIILMIIVSQLLDVFVLSFISYPAGSCNCRFCVLNSEWWGKGELGAIHWESGQEKVKKPFLCLLVLYIVAFYQLLLNKYECCTKVLHLL